MLSCEIHIVAKPWQLVLLGFFVGFGFGFFEIHGQEVVRERMRDLCEKAEIFTIGKGPEVYSCIHLKAYGASR